MSDKPKVYIYKPFTYSSKMEQTNEKKTNDTDVKLVGGVRTSLKVLVFKDEFINFGITSTTPYNEAVTTIRAKLELVERYKMGSKKTSMARLVREATPEQLEVIQGILNPQE